MKYFGLYCLNFKKYPRAQKRKKHVFKRLGAAQNFLPGIVISR